MSRSFCYQCQRVNEACFCHKVIQIDNPVSVYVLQHPDESRINKGTAIIAKLSLKNYQCWQGEDFSAHPGLNQLIQSAADSVAVVYPSEKACSVEDSLSENDTSKKIRHLIFIDATWRKAKKIWSLSTNLQALRTIKLDANNKSNYRIRKVPADGYLSTVEAITVSLSAIDQQPEKYQPLLNVFDSMIDFQIEQMGQQTFEHNYNNE